MERLVLGLDIGTTSVKVCLVDIKEKKVVARQSKDTQAGVPSELGCEGNKQNVPKIISAVHICVSRLPKELLRQVESIGVCGQMHGVMLWQHENSAPWVRADIDSSRYEVISDQVSSLYTWQDSRCDPSFLESLPRPESHLRAYSGYGCNTLFWIAKNRPEKLSHFNCAGTVQDFMVAMLCNLKRPVMSIQNAASWGYFDTETCSWNKSSLESAGFPVHLLPDVVKSKAVVGHLTEQWHGIPAGTPVEASPVEYFPYFDEQYLAVATALNGGNALATFVKMLQQWTLELGFNVPQSTVWSRLLELGASSSAESTLCVVPTLLGERHAPEQNASISNIDPGNLSLGQVFKAICKGIVHNLHSMMPREMLIKANISRILGIGSTLTRNEVLQKEVHQCYQLPVVFVPGGDAAWGAAMAVMDNCSN